MFNLCCFIRSFFLQQIVHLKRFQFNNGRWGKSQKIVNFPLNGLEPKAYDSVTTVTQVVPDDRLAERQVSVTPPINEEGEVKPLEISVELHNVDTDCSVERDSKTEEGGEADTKTEEGIQRTNEKELEEELDESGGKEAELNAKEVELEESEQPVKSKQSESNIEEEPKETEGEEPKETEGEEPKEPEGEEPKETEGEEPKETEGEEPKETEGEEPKETEGEEPKEAEEEEPNHERSIYDLFAVTVRNYTHTAHTPHSTHATPT